ncbi:TetR family transcriptional regulator [Nocardioides hwasunensis]|uniref:TetR family transcriptional regulator n=1 Tax=Nocardioides hwasunensis TaxID=397258 RepID=A0ABR8MDR3_9ACTN|nr:TetR family transcriptional regulator [Nocardioides hwasunensis]MBD3914263.1 TetR family transcriptional regulator [Nocardioides hwasunensis]
MPSTRDRLIDAAFALFEERGFDETTVDDVAARAEVGRTTFFRAFRSKEDVIFPDHDAMLGAVSARLATATAATVEVAVTEAAHVVLAHYLAEGTRAQQRYRLTRSVPALRSREVASLLQYQQVFRTFLHGWTGGTARADLRAELLANAVVTAHNHVLRRWLRETITAGEAEAEFATSMDEVLRIFADPAPSVGGTAVVVLRSDQPVESLLPALREVVARPET